MMLGHKTAIVEMIAPAKFTTTQNNNITGMSPCIQVVVCSLIEFEKFLAPGSR